MPNPAPCLAWGRMDGAKRSRTENVAAATTEMRRTSSSFGFRPGAGMKYAANPTVLPSRRYLESRTIASDRSIDGAIMTNRFR